MNQLVATPVIRLTQAEIAAMLAEQGIPGADERENYRSMLEDLPNIVLRIRPYAYANGVPTVYSAVRDILYNFDSDNRHRVSVELRIPYQEMIALLSGYVLGKGD